MHKFLFLILSVVLFSGNTFAYFLCSSQNESGTIHSINILYTYKKQEATVVAVDRPVSVGDTLCDEIIGSDEWKWSCMPNSWMPRTMKWEIIEVDGVEYARYYEPELNKELNLNKPNGLYFDKPIGASEGFESEVFVNTWGIKQNYKIYCRHGDIG